MCLSNALLQFTAQSAETVSGVDLGSSGFQIVIAGEGEGEDRIG